MHNLVRHVSTVASGASATSVNAYAYAHALTPATATSMASGTQTCSAPSSPTVTKGSPSQQRYRAPDNLGDSEIVQKLRVRLHNDLPASVQRGNFVLFRHAFSQYNYVFDSFLADTGKPRIHDDSKYLRFDTQYLDSPLHRLGAQQAKNMAPIVQAKLKMRIVFVSPLRRTMETARFLFSPPGTGSAPYHRPRLVVLPYLSEILSIAASMQTPTQLRVLREQFTEFDFSLMDSLFETPFYQIEMLEDEGTKQRLLKRLRTAHESVVRSQHARRASTGTEVPLSRCYTQIVLDEMQRLWPKRPLEDYPMLFARTERAKSVIKQYVARIAPDLLTDATLPAENTATGRCESPPVTEKIGIVSHQATITCFTSETTPYGIQSSGIPLKNCQAQGFSLSLSA